MKISKTIETEEGGVKFEGELAAAELDLIIGVGLNYLMKAGALPMQVVEEVDFSKIAPGTETQQ